MLLGFVFAVGCGTRSTADRILADEKLFVKGYPEAVAKTRKECPGLNAAADQYVHSSGNKVASVRTQLSLSVPGNQPLIADVQRMYGPADSTDAGSYNYGDIRFETNNGIVVKVIVDCSKQE